ncbi:RNA polymerase sigma factor [Roseivirga sp. E12]|uniref:RNA polymerase sigma factor n=1 Tax=Roseivirga sp. E12 TaxID=2819237 RepID=UPI001ABCF76D|nr:RNA polymerase sigma-70 factor [Roseivirga sp. E12]MBO3697704.1 RNA polymerase sigma-70 factor [Roseivirga sp. E12]
MKRLLEKLKAGDEKSLDEFVYLNLSKVFNFCYALLKSREEAEEVCQDVFVKFWNNRDKLDLNLSVDGLLFRIAKNLTLNKIRDNQKYKGSLEVTDGLLVGNSTMEDVLFREMEQTLHKAIEALPPKRRLIFELSRFQGLSNREISERLNISINTVEGQIRKAIKSIHIYTDSISI